MPVIPEAPAADFTIVCRHAEQTRRLGENCGRHIRVPMVLFLIGDLGSGKTVFVQGLARGLEVPGGYYITSPSFTLINEYPGRLPFFHIDLYRLESGVDLDDLGLSEVFRGDGVAAVEWADKLPSGSMSDRLEVRFEAADGDDRILRFFAYGQDAASLLNQLALFTDSLEASDDHG